MPEAKLLFGIAAVVILGLVGWVIAVLRAPRETWARDHVLPAAPIVEEPPLVTPATESEAPPSAAPAPPAGTDDKAG